MIVQAPDNNSTAARTLVSGRMLAWEEYRMIPDIAVRQSLGQAGELEVETKVRQSICTMHRYLPQRKDESSHHRMKSNLAT